MTDKEIFEKLEAEIERLENYENESVTSSDTRFGWIHGKTFALTSIRVLLDSMQKEPASEDLGKVGSLKSLEYYPEKKTTNKTSKGVFDANMPRRKAYLRGFKDGAHAHKELIANKPVSGDLEAAIDTYLATYFGSEKEKQEWPFLKKMAIHFANWKEQQLMAKAVDGNKAGNREQLSPEMKALLSQKVEELDLSVRTRNILKANDIDTIRDLCRLKKIDFLYFRNGGKRSLTELDDFLIAHNLTWGMNV